ncbi:MAG: T9SS type A sorting domain-containing protein [Ignavibacteriales bacterium]|nr:T9SS type A sorting domain-containing protein [Ignavibacteriales bacterium]
MKKLILILLMPFAQFYILSAQTVTGKLVNITGEGLSGLQLQLYISPNVYSTTSGIDGSFTFANISDVETENTLPSGYNISNNYPNPFNPLTRINITLPKASKVKIDLFNIVGERVRSVIEKDLGAGNNFVDIELNGLANGFYIARITVDQQYTVLKKLMLLYGSQHLTNSPGVANFQLNKSSGDIILDSIVVSSFITGRKTFTNLPILTGKTIDVGNLVVELIVTEKLENFTGQVKLPDNSTVTLQNLSLVTPVNEANVNSDGSVVVESYQDKYSFTYLLDEKDNMIGASYSNLTNNFEINETTTALAVAFMFPVDWGIFGLTPNQLMIEISQHSKFPALKNIVRDLMVNDPKNLMNYQAHPDMLKTAAEIVLDIVHNHGGILQKKSGISNILSGPVYIEDVPNDGKIKIINPRATPYGICSYNTDKNPLDKDSYSMWSPPLYVYGRGINWWILPTNGETEYSIGDGYFILTLSRSDPRYCLASEFLPVPLIGAISFVMDQNWEVANGDYYKILKANSKLKGLLGGLIYVTARSLGIVSVVDPSEATGFLQIALDYGPTAAELFTEVTLSGENLMEGGITALPGFLVPTIKRNAERISVWASKYGSKVAPKALQAGIGNLTVILDFVGAGEDAFLLGWFFYDSFFSESDLTFYIKQKNGNAKIYTTQPAPTVPTVSGVFNGIADSSYNYTVSPSDSDCDNVKYKVYYGDGTVDESDYVTNCQSYMFSHSYQAGNYEISVQAIDRLGFSSEQSQPIKVTIVSTTFCPEIPTVAYAGKIYNSVQIGAQCWLRENLDVGTRIDGAAEQTNNSTIEKYCYDNLESNCDTYGGLYQWNEAMQYVTTQGTKGICPTGWHIPTLEEFQTLATTVNNDGNALKAIGQGTGAGAGTNISGFSALFAGYRYESGFAGLLANYTYNWSSTAYDTIIYRYSFHIYYDGSNIELSGNGKQYGFSVRCLKD